MMRGKGEEGGGGFFFSLTGFFLIWQCFSLAVLFSGRQGKSDMCVCVCEFASFFYSNIIGADCRDYR